MADRWFLREGWKINDRFEYSYEYKRTTEDGHYTYESRRRIIDHENEENYAVESNYQARAFTVVTKSYEIEPPEQKDGLIPVDVALSGNPDIAVYLHGGLLYSSEEVCEIMDVSIETLYKYITRVENNSEI